MPYLPVMYGKRQTLPRPIAQPAEIRIKPSREPKVSRFCIVFFLSEYKTSAGNTLLRMFKFNVTLDVLDYTPNFWM